MLFWNEWKTFTRYDERGRLFAKKWAKIKKNDQEKEKQDDDDDDDEDDDDAVCPGKIVNDELLLEDKLKDMLIMEAHYTVVCAKSWQLLVEWHGGGPAIERRIIEVGLTKRLQVEVYPLELVVEELGVRAGQEFVHTVSKQASGNELRAQLGARLYVAPHKLRLWHDNGRDGCALMRESEMLETLEDRRVMVGHKIFAQVRLPNGEFCSDDEPASSAASGYSQYMAFSGAGGGGSRFGRWGFGFGGGGGAARIQYSDSKEEPMQTGVCGLVNLGNTCFMNSALQCLSNVPALAEYFLDDERWRAELNKGNALGSGGAVAVEFAKLVGKLWNGNVSFTPPVDLKWTIGKHAPQFTGYRQHDTQELCAFVLDALHEDLNRVVDKVPTESMESDGRPDPIVAREAWNRNLLRNQSIVVDLFEGQYKSTVRCPECPRVSITFDPFRFLSLPLPGHKMRDINVLFFPAAGGQRHFKMSVRVDKTGTVRDLAETIASTLGDGVAADDLDVCITLFGYIQRSFKPHAELFSVGARSVNVYEAPVEASIGGEQQRKPKSKRDKKAKKKDDNDGDGDGSTPSTSIRVALMVRRQVRRSYAPTTPTYDTVGEPFVLRYSGDTDEPDLSVDRLYDDVHRKMLGYFEFVEPTTNADGGDDDEKAKKKSESDESTSGDDYPFVLKLVDAKAAYCAAEGCGSPCRGCSLAECAKNGTLEVRRNVHLAVDVTNKKVLALAPERHSSAAAPSEQRSDKAKDKDDDDDDESDEAIGNASGLEQCLSLFSEEERLSEDNAWYCNVCQKHQEAAKKIDLFRLPDVIIVHLKRFQYTAAIREKLDLFVSYPIDSWDLSAHEHEAGGFGRPPPLYDLIGVVNHMGGLGGGHYTAYARNKIDDQWYHFNDSGTSLVEKRRTIASPAAYLLFYRRRGAPDIPERQHISEEASTNHAASSSSK
jgi:ubiquitin C-terminal hydrolase